MPEPVIYPTYPLSPPPSTTTTPPTTPTYTQTCGCNVAVGAEVVVGERTLPAHPSPTDSKHAQWCSIHLKAKYEESARQAWLIAKAATEAEIALFNEAGIGGIVV